MDEPSDPPRHPNLTERAAADRLARREREAAALRANLKKRKARQRERADPPDPPKPGDEPA
jgi:hypothetical protein